jgi:hypothetical protein
MKYLAPFAQRRSNEYLGTPPAIKRKATQVHTSLDLALTGTRFQ